MVAHSDPRAPAHAAVHEGTQQTPEPTEDLPMHDPTPPADSPTEPTIEPAREQNPGTKRRPVVHPGGPEAGAPCSM